MKRPTRLFGISVALILFALGLARADEGMWLFNLPPTAKIKAKYGFELTKTWLDHTRLSSVRFDNGGSGSFVSPDGLVFTNHHIAAECVHDLSTGGKDYMKTGFYAKTHADEAKCPDLELNVLESIEDVTDKVKAVTKPGMSVAQQGEARRAAMSAIEQDCVKATKLRCDVVTFYSGAMYHLYEYKRYTDVRLVFAPEFAAAFFGGDPDNFEYPRYDLDISFFRIYENNQPVHLDNYFKWSTGGLKEGDLVFVSGNPGSTGRLNTMAQLEFLRDTAYPLQLQSLARRDVLLKKFSAASPENARIAQEDIFGIENSFKAIRGYDSGLYDQTEMTKKQAGEDKMRQAVASDPAKKSEFGDPWPEIAKAMAITRDGAAIANIRFATEGTATYPDATFTLRLSYGAVRGYTEDGRGVAPKGTKLPYFTTIGGAFEHAAQHNNKDPYALPESWLNAKSKLNLNTPLNVAETADIIGGNSGSPVLNANGEIVGIIFDGDIQSLPWNFVYDDTLGRSIQVDSRGILEALRNIYSAGALADELTGKSTPVH